ncbi:DUF3102 domain-containing protein (plasmid) [Roseomonas sp. OT10]|uniref:DUF3102 domain-containing protein n=1 Tax=Roseomonas cutis TaxID=2897332 RepID=UPI001E4D8B55|nr:DUF3102 domain-containing protein [Roseomonas sp. OT10]UFN51608.1 DUF3102 domain-containing protein [Roseomonas sp. OT10]
MSAKRLKLDQAPEPVLLEGDARVHALQVAKAEPRRADEFVAEITLLWSRAQNTFLDIGRLLIRAKDMLPHGEYIAAVEAHLPFSGRTAYQLREAARWAIEMDRQKAIPVERLPGSYSTIYLLSTLDPPLLRQAEAEGLIRPELRRAELVAWRRNQGAEPVETRQSLLARREKLQRERDRLEDELRRIEAALTSRPGRD